MLMSEAQWWAKSERQKKYLPPPDYYSIFPNYNSISPQKVTQQRSTCSSDTNGVAKHAMAVCPPLSSARSHRSASQNFRIQSFSRHMPHVTHMLQDSNKRCTSRRMSRMSSCSKLCTQKEKDGEDAKKE